jgi:hypothetical protein
MMTIQVLIVSLHFALFLLLAFKGMGRRYWSLGSVFFGLVFLLNIYMNDRKSVMKNHSNEPVMFSLSVWSMDLSHDHWGLSWHLERAGGLA